MKEHTYVLYIWGIISTTNASQVTNNTCVCFTSLYIKKRIHFIKNKQKWIKKQTTSEPSALKWSSACFLSSPFIDPSSLWVKGGERKTTKSKCVQVYKLHDITKRNQYLHSHTV